jgi:hypothetical protein
MKRKTIRKLIKFPFFFLPRLAVVILLVYVLGFIGCYKTICPQGKALVLLAVACSFCWPLLLFLGVVVESFKRLGSALAKSAKKSNRFAYRAIR